MVNILVKILHIQAMEKPRERACDMETHSIGLVPNRVFSITIVSDSYHAFDLLAMKNYDVIVLNEGLDDMRAHETAQIIRNSNPSIPLLLLAAEGDMSVEHRLVDIQRCGFSHVLANPFTDDDYFFAVDAMCIEKAAVQSQRLPDQVFPTSSSMNADHIDTIMHLALARLMQQCPPQQTRRPRTTGDPMSPHHNHHHHRPSPSPSPSSSPSPSYYHIEDDSPSPRGAWQEGWPTPGRSMRTGTTSHPAAISYASPATFAAAAGGHYTDRDRGLVHPSALRRESWNHPNLR